MASIKKPGAGVEPGWLLMVWPLFFLGFWEILLLAQNPGLMADDSGEMVAAAVNLGVAHPPGYPLFCLLGRLFSLLPVGTEAFRMNLMSAVFGLLALSLFYSVCREAGRGAEKSGSQNGLPTVLAFAAALALFSNSDFFPQCLTAKGAVYTLTLLFLVFFLWLWLRSLRGGSKTGNSSFVAFLWALSLTHHWQTAVLWAPFLFFVVRQGTKRWTLPKIIFLFMVFLVGLSIYLYLPLRSSVGAEPSWGSPGTLKGFFWSISRGPFKGLESPSHPLAVYVDFIKEYLRSLCFSWVPGLAGLSLIGIFDFWRNRKELLGRLAWFYLPMVLGIITVPRKETLFLTGIYLVPSNALWAFAAFNGLRRIVLALWDWNRLAAGWMVFFVLTGTVVWTGKTALEGDKSGYFLEEDFGLNVLKGTPAHSLLLAEGDHYVMPIWYEKYVRRKRPDLIFEPTVFLAHSWGWEQLGTQFGNRGSFLRQPGTFLERFSFLTEGRQARPLFYSLGREALKAAGKTPGFFIPDGLVLEWKKDKPAGGVPEGPFRTQVASERIRGFDWQGADPDFSSGEIYRYYARQYFEMAQFSPADRGGAAALIFFGKGLHYYPEAFAFGDMAVLLARQGYLKMAVDLCQKGIQVDPDYLPNYLNLAMSYEHQGERGKALESYRRALALEPHFGEISLRIQALEGRLALLPDPFQKNPLDYKKLGRQLEKEDLPWLARIAYSYGEFPPKDSTPSGSGD